MITRSSGFSLVELLVVVAIIGILSATGMVLYSGYIQSAKASAAKNRAIGVMKEYNKDTNKIFPIFEYLSANIHGDPA